MYTFAGTSVPFSAASGHVLGNDEKPFIIYLQEEITLLNDLCLRCNCSTWPRFRQSWPKVEIKTL